MIAAVDDTTLTYGTDYVVANRQVTFSPAPASGTLIVIKRQTSTERLVSWQDASVLKASDMTLAQVQQLHILEEQQDWIKTNSMVTDDENRWNALNHRIINVSDPINDQDAVTKNYVENLGNSFKTLLDTTTTQDIQRLESKTQEGLAALDLQTTLDLETLKALSEEMKEIAKDVNVFIPSVTENIISWTNKAGLPNPDPVNIKGEQGSPGKDGTAATITIGTVTTGEPGSNASVTNVGTDTAAILDISIPRGDKGADGAGAGDVIAAADNTFTATNTFDGTLKTTCDMQHYSQTIGGTMTLDSSSDNLQTLYVTNDAATIRFTDPDMPDVYKKTFIVDVHRTGSGVFSVATDNNIGGNAATAYIIGGTLPDIAAGEILKLGVEISTEVNAVYVYVIGKVVL